MEAMLVRREKQILLREGIIERIDEATNVYPERKRSYPLKELLFHSGEVWREKGNDYMPGMVLQHNHSPVEEEATIGMGK